MTKTQLVNILEEITNFSYAYLYSLTLKELQKIYEDRK